MADWEAIVVDDKSTAGDVAGVVAGFPDPRISLLVHDRNRGLAAARNTAIRAGGAEWFLPLDADDELHPGFLATALAAAEEHPDRDVIFTDFLWIGAVRGVMRYRAQGLREMLLCRAMPGPGLLARRRVWESIGGYCEAAPLRIGCEDYEFWVAALERGVKAHHVPAPLYRYRRHSASTMARGSPDYHLAREFIHARHLATFDACGAGNRFLGDGYWRSAHYRLSAGRRAGGLIFALRAVVAGGRHSDIDYFLRLLAWLFRGPRPLTFSPTPRST